MAKNKKKKGIVSKFNDFFDKYITNGGTITQILIFLVVAGILGAYFFLVPNN